MEKPSYIYNSYTPKEKPALKITLLSTLCNSKFSQYDWLHINVDMRIRNDLQAIRNLFVIQG
ncbi:hypothetical protein NQ317_007023 [Molorchus minor]|uniref:Uncharacterized protein n=1 Tax=Molorchus minor TaxID=1323400 RepID=A0ABQ9JTA9_9CUCU|nr:hypothetical protein NQ317_007023 [Molorchus minor]